MTMMTSDAWVPKARKRKAYRDAAREKFWGEVGLAKGAHVQGLTGAPQDGAGRLQDLLTLTSSGSILDAGHKAIIAGATASLHLAGLGTGEMGKQAENIQNLTSFGMDSLRKNWFWSPAFFD